MELPTLFVKLEEVAKEFALNGIYLPEGWEEIKVTTSEINRPGLEFDGYLTHFDNLRLQIVGSVEHYYLKELGAEKRYQSCLELFRRGFPALIITSGREPFAEMIEAAKQTNTPLFSVNTTASELMANIISSLRVKLAERITRHGVLVEVYGEGILLLGESGVGKSETAMELLKRGHRLIADDAVEIKKVSNKTLVGSSPDIIKHLIELRGIGIVDVRRLFGMGAVKDSEKLDLIINLEIWDENAHYDRFGLEEQYTEILGLNIPSLKIPVRPGRNLAMIIEVAAMNNRLKKMGYNSAQELNKRLMAEYESNL
ncbi:MAG: HPr(Ser) kinase/phosphatase [Clostridia bacterium]|nr:HPr(Ser) kinase/phosphatase [Clostridia bacterium]